MTDMNEFTNKDPYTTKVEEVTCRLCEKVFPIDVQYGKDGLPRFFRPKYCNECNLKMKINNNVCVSSNDATWGSVNIDIAKVPQNRVEGLEKTLEDIAVCVNDSRKRVGDLEHSVELNKKKIDDFLMIQIGANDRVNLELDENKHNLNVFKSAQKYFNDDQIGINLAHFTLIKEIHKTLIIGFSVLVVFMLVTWGYLTYTFFNQ